MKEEVRKTNYPADEKKAVITRLNRMRGQLDGIVKMVEDDRYCNDVLIQLGALCSGSRSLISYMLESYLKTDILGKLKSDKQEVVDELVELLKRI